MEKNKHSRALYLLAFISVICGAVVTSMGIQKLSEIFGIGAFVFLACGVILDVVSEIVVKTYS